jgi:adenosine deaminase
VDRHTHLEGSLDSAWVRSQALAAGRTVPAELTALWQGRPVPFEGFIKAFLFGCGFLTGPEAVREAVLAAVERLPPARPGLARGIDLWVSPHFLVKVGHYLSLDQLWRGLDEGVQAAAARGVRVVAVIDAVNHLGPAHGHEVLDLVLGDRPPWVAGLSTGGLEGTPFRAWAPVFERARQAGLRLAAHAGENGLADNVKEAILEAGVERIVHGVRASDRPDIVELLVERRIALDQCLTSNRALVPDLGNHPLPGFLRAGVRCALGTDDPGLIPCTLPGEWAETTELGLTEAEQLALFRHAQEDAWCMQVVKGA